MDHTDNEITIGELLRAIWDQRRTVFIFAMVAGLLGGIYAGAKFLHPSAPIEHSIIVQFPFKGAAEGEYPNGQSFSLGDVTSNSVLSSIYEQLELNGIGVKFEDFARAVSIRPYAVNRDFIVAKYSDRLSNSRLSQAEINELESAFQQELNSASRRAARITFSSGRLDEMGGGLIEQVLFRIPAEWSRIKIEQHGVLDYNEFPMHPLDIDAYSEAEFIVGLYQIKDGIGIMQRALETIEEDPRMAVVSDPQTGMTVDDISNKLNTIRSYQVSRLEKEVEAADVYRDRGNARLFFEGRLIELTDDIDVAKEKAEVYDQVIEQFESMKNAARRGTLGAPESVTAELGDQFLEQLLQLGDDVANAKFRQELISKKLELEVEVRELQGEARRVERFLRLLASDTPVNEEQAEDVADKYTRLVTEMSDLQDAYVRLISNARSTRLGSAGALYRGLVEKPITSDPFMGNLKRLVLVLLVLVILGAFLGMLFALMKLSMNSTKGEN